jgi:hypothetical protein
MEKAQLVSHINTHLVSEAVVRAEPRPEFTDSWHPFAHGEIIDAVSGACASLGWKVGRKEYAIRQGAEMFGTWEIGNFTNAEMNFALGFRNSLNKYYAVGLCAGAFVFVCDNRAFRGDFVVFRKHTGALEIEEITLLAQEALLQLPAKFDAFVKWNFGLKEHGLSDREASLLLLAAASKKTPLVPPSKIPEFRELYFDAGSKYTRTMHGFHGAVTEMFKRLNPVEVPWRSSQLVRFIDYEAPLLLDPRETGIANWNEPLANLPMIEAAAAKKAKEHGEAKKAIARHEAEEIKGRVTEKLKASKKAEIKGPPYPIVKIALTPEEKKKAGILVPAHKVVRRGMIKKAHAAEPPIAEKKAKRTLKRKISEKITAERTAKKAAPAKGRKAKIQAFVEPRVGDVLGYRSPFEELNKKHGGGGEGESKA